MQRFLGRVVRAPLTYIADLRALTMKQYLLIHTNFSPSYPLMVGTGFIFSMLLAALLLFSVFGNAQSSTCFQQIRGGSYVIAVLYPIETIMCFICLTGTIALSKSNCWRLSWMLLFGPILSGFAYGEVGLVEVCLLAREGLIHLPTTLESVSFLQAMVYLYLTFLVLYFLMIPSINFLYQRQLTDKEKQRLKEKEQKKKENKLKKSKKPQPKRVSKVPVDKGQKPKEDPNKKQGQQDKKQQKNKKQEEAEKKQKGQYKPKEDTCCQKALCILYYILNFIFVISVIFIILIKLLGPVLLTYTWLSLASNASLIESSMQKMMLAITLLAYFGPLSVMIITLGVQRVVKLGRKQPADNSAAGDSARRPTITEMEKGVQGQKEETVRAGLL